jgi:hypothetical protein
VAILTAGRNPIGTEAPHPYALLILICARIPGVQFMAAAVRNLFDPFSAPASR